jgi:Bacterial Ig-like domain (group 3)
MKFARLASRVAVGGVSAALATAGLVGVTSTSASAAPVTTNYTCATPLASFPIPVSVDIALLPSTAPAGFAVPAGLLSFNSTATVPGAAQTALDSLPGGPVTGGKATDFGTAFGTTVAPAPVAWTKPAAADGSGNWVYTGKGSNGAFLLPKAGTYSVNMPSKFTLLATNASGATVATATCTNAAPSALGSITLSKQKSTVKAKATPASAKKGATITVKGKVKNEFSKVGGVAVTGKVIIKDGKKKVGTAKIKKGKFKASIKGLKVGSHTLTVLYKGDDFTDKGTSKALKVTIKA